MSQPYVGEIRMFGGNFAPAGWAFCDGRTLAIADYDVLYVLIGTTYGGDGQSTFALPNLKSRLPLHQGTSTAGSTFVMGQMSGVESVTLTTQQMPAHTHTVLAQTTNGNQQGPGGAVWAPSAENQFSTGAPNAAMDATSVQPVGGSQAHDNIMPFLAVNFIIALYGIFPSRN